MTDRFPEIASAATKVMPEGTVSDGELVIWDGARLDFDLLQQRLAGGAANIARQVRDHPASYIVFDLLALAGADLRNEPLRKRRQALEGLTRTWGPPLQLSPMTTDLDVAMSWMADYRPAGLEGLVVKGADTRYQPGARRWVKYNSVGVRSPNLTRSGV